MNDDRALLRAQLMRHEGLRLAPYLDTVGKVTIGYGRNLTDTGIAEDEAAFLLENDIEKAASAVQAHLPWAFGGLGEARRAVLVNMAFNLGIGGLLSFKATLSAIQRGRYEEAADHMLDSKWAVQTGNRAVELAEQMRTGEWAA